MEREKIGHYHCVVLVIALAAAGSGFTVLQRRDSSQMAFDACQQAITINQKSVTRLKKTVESTTSATQTAADAVADPQTIDNLKAAIDKVVMSSRRRIVAVLMLKPIRI